VFDTELLDDLRHPQADAHRADDPAKVDEREHEHAPVRHGVAQLTAVLAADIPLLGGEAARERGFLLIAEPGGLVGTVGQDEQTCDAEQHSGQAFDQQQPLPAFQAVQAAQLKQCA